MAVGALPSFQDLLDEEKVPVPESLRVNTCPDIPQRSLGTDRWTCAQYAALERERLWSRTWQMVCRETALLRAGDFFVYDVSGYSVILVRDESGQLRGYHNSCLHRGRALKSGRGRAREIRCPYHGFCWNLDGSFKEAFCSQEFSPEVLGKLSLPEVQVACWGGWVFINMDLGAQTFSDYSGVLEAHFSRWQPEARYVSLHIEKRLRCNWKVALEAFIESYHSIQTHPQILSFTGGDNSQYDVFSPQLSRTITPQGIPNPGQADRFTALQTVDDMLGQGSFERACALSGQTPENLTSRQAIAALRRDALSSVLPETLLAGATQSELMDSILYLLFPNFAPWGGFQSQITYRYRPIDSNPNTCVMDLYFLDSFPEGTSRPPDASTVCLDFDDGFAEVSDLGGLATIFDQDANNLPEVQRGLIASRYGKIMTAEYQECRIRHFHQTLDHYLEVAVSPCKL